ncbi:MAG: COG4705 family protein, partial [Ktedonobacteraceae bacterium]
ADVLHVVLGIPYVVSTAFFILALVIIFVAWYASERTLSIHSITTTRRELFYWATVMATFALGTAVGDLTAATLGLGYFSSGILFAILFAIPALAYWLFRLNAIFAFWFAYIMTRPLGASFADWFGKPILGGLGLGDTWVSLVLTILIVIFVGYVTVTHKDVKGEHR